MADDTFTKEQVEAAIKDAIDKEVSGLKEKNDELIADNKKLKSDLRKTQDIKPEDVAALEHEIDELKGKLSTAEKAAKDATKAAETAAKALETESAFTQRLLIQDGLKGALIANGVKDETFIDALTAKFASGATVTVDGDARKAMIGDKSLEDAVKEFAASDAGKKFVSAPANSGGGAQGGSQGSQSGKTIAREAFGQMAPAEQMTFVKEGGKVVDQAA